MKAKLANFDACVRDASLPRGPKAKTSKKQGTKRREKKNKQGSLEWSAGGCTVTVSLDEHVITER
jgi:hypothetical protein